MHWKVKIHQSKKSLNGCFEGFIRNRLVDKASDRQETSISNSSQSEKSSTSSLLLFKSLGSHTNQEEELALHTASRMFSLGTTVLSNQEKGQRYRF